MKKEKISLLRQDGFQTLLASLICILGGLVVGWLVLLGDLGIYEIIPGFIASLVVAVVVSLATKAPSNEVTAIFDKVASGKEFD